MKYFFLIYMFHFIIFISLGFISLRAGSVDSFYIAVLSGILAITIANNMYEIESVLGKKKESKEENGKT